MISLISNENINPFTFPIAESINNLKCVSFIFSTRRHFAVLAIVLSQCCFVSLRPRSFLSRVLCIQSSRSNLSFAKSIDYLIRNFQTSKFKAFAVSIPYRNLFCFCQKSTPVLVTLSRIIYGNRFLTFESKKCTKKWQFCSTAPWIHSNSIHGGCNRSFAPVVTIIYSR